MRTMFEFEHPSGGNRADARWKGNEIPGRIFQNGLVFGSHGGKPRGMVEGVRERDRLGTLFNIAQ